MNRRQQSRFKEIVLSHLLKMKGSLSLAAVCLIGYTAIDLLKPWPLKFLFDYVLLQQPLPASLATLQGMLQDGLLLPLGIVAGSIVCISVLSGVFSYGQLYLTSKVGFELSATLRRELFSRLQRLSLSFHHQTRTGELLTNVSSDTTALRDKGFLPACGVEVCEGEGGLLSNQAEESATGKGLAAHGTRPPVGCWLRIADGA